MGWPRPLDKPFGFLPPSLYTGVQAETKGCGSDEEHYHRRNRSGKERFPITRGGRLRDGISEEAAHPDKAFVVYGQHSPVPCWD